MLDTLEPSWFEVHAANAIKFCMAINRLGLLYIKKFKNLNLADTSFFKPFPAQTLNRVER